MVIRLWRCLTSTCTVIWFSTPDGVCARCGQPGALIENGSLPPFRLRGSNNPEDTQ